MLWAGELASVEVPKNLDEKDERRIRQYNVYATRAAAAEHAFAELRTAQMLAEIHLGRPAAEWIEVLFRGRQEVFAAVEELYGGPTLNAEGLEGQYVEEHQEFQRSMRRLLSERGRAGGVPAENDELSKRIDAAKAGLESACRPFLDDPPWLKRLPALLVRHREAQ